MQEWGRKAQGLGAGLDMTGIQGWVYIGNAEAGVLYDGRMFSAEALPVYMGDIPGISLTIDSVIRSRTVCVVLTHRTAQYQLVTFSVHAPYKQPDDERPDSVKQFFEYIRCVYRAYCKQHSGKPRPPLLGGGDFNFLLFEPAHLRDAVPAGWQLLDYALSPRRALLGAKDHITHRLSWRQWPAMSLLSSTRAVDLWTEVGVPLCATGCAVGRKTITIHDAVIAEFKIEFPVCSGCDGHGQERRCSLVCNESVCCNCVMHCSVCAVSGCSDCLHLSDDCSDHSDSSDHVFCGRCWSSARTVCGLFECSQCLKQVPEFVSITRRCAMATRCDGRLGCRTTETQCTQCPELRICSQCGRNELPSCVQCNAGTLCDACAEQQLNSVVTGLSLASAAAAAPGAN